MNISKEETQRTEFCNILYELAKSQTILNDPHERANMYIRLEKLYELEDGKLFRHYYSDIFSVLSSIHSDAKLGSIDQLGQNLEIIRRGYTPKNMSSNGDNLIDISISLKKMYDHVNLEIARMLFQEKEYKINSGETSLKELKRQINTAQMDLETSKSELNSELKNVKKKLDNSQKEYITILGIFAAVVLAFTGGIAFSTSVLNNISQASIYRIVIITLILGTVLINVLYGLFYYISELLNKPLKFQHIRLINIVLIVLIVVTVIIWLIGVVEWRNNWVINR